MSNTFGIPSGLEDEIRARDKRCVYCWKPMSAHLHTRGAPSDKATIEHLGGPPIYQLKFQQRGFDKASIAICCGSCNSRRKGTPIIDWFATRYCVERGINVKTVAPVVQRFRRTGRYNLYRWFWWARRPRGYREEWLTRQAKQAGPRSVADSRDTT